MRLLKWLSLVFCGAILCTTFVSTTQAAFPEYVDQDSETTNIRSGISTKDGIPIWDNVFASMVRNPWWIWNPLNADELAFGFMQCYGGGMIDDLELASMWPTSYTSAAKHNQASWWGNQDPASGGLSESYYNLHYSPWVGGAALRRHDQAGQNAYNNDRVGPVVNNPWRESPQYMFNYPFMDRTDITLHQPNIDGQPTNYLAILWGGSTNNWANYNSLARIHSDLIARGYTSNEIYLMCPANRKPNGAALPAGWVVDDGTNFQDMVDAWQWANLQSDPNTQVYFWSNICHGTRTEDLVNYVLDNYAEPIQPGKPYGFDLAADLVNQVKELFYFFEPRPDANLGRPYFQVIVPQMVADLSVVLNSELLSLVSVTDYNDGSQISFFYQFGLDSTDINNLSPTGNVFELNWSGPPVDFIMAGVTTGNMSNAIPEPNSLSLLTPNGGEELISGSMYEILWESGAGIDDVLIEYSANKGQDWTPTVPSNVGNTGSYEWDPVPAVDSNECLVRISDQSVPDVNDTSDAVFTIYQCIGPIAGDLNGDCYVNWKDFASFAATWLDCGNPFDPACGVE